MSAIRDDLAEQAVRLAVRASGEEQFAGLRRVPVAEPQTPQAVDDDRLAIGLPQLAAAGAVVRVVDVDLTVAEVSNEQITAELAEARRREGEHPRRVSWPRVTRRLTRAPSLVNTSTKPCPCPATSSCSVASCSA